MRSAGHQPRGPTLTWGIRSKAFEWASNALFSSLIWDPLSGRERESAGSHTYSLDSRVVMGSTLESALATAKGFQGCLFQKRFTLHQLWGLSVLPALQLSFPSPWGLIKNISTPFYTITCRYTSIESRKSFTVVALQWEPLHPLSSTRHQTEGFRQKGLTDRKDFKLF